MTTLTESQQSLIALSLRIASERFALDAEAMAVALPGQPGLVRQFREQQGQALHLAEMFEDAECIKVQS